jgi:hypothetical protein
VKPLHFGKIVFESSLIVFSVLLALLLNEYREMIKEEQEKERALQMIQIELKGNRDTLSKWLPYHKQILKNFTEAVDKDSLEGLSLDDQRLLIMKKIPKGVVIGLLETSAWEAIKLSNIPSNLNVETIFALSKLYNIQNQGVRGTLSRISTTLNSRELVGENNSKHSLFLLKSLFYELVAQEIYLIEYYKN